ncbi:MAG: DUF3828 domain-containing protein [Proteobacteria bacterium]|nr:DUF3828 domain-containing protein [Pseudomonadota bacterium]
MNRRRFAIVTCALTLAAALSLLLPGRAWAQSTPEQTVNAFYRDYMTAVERSPRNWVETLVNGQKANLDAHLAAGLLEMAGNTPESGKPWLDFDPFGNSQMGTKSFTVRSAVNKNGQILVPVAILLNRDQGPAKVRVTAVVKQWEPGGKYIITNFLYPAEYGAPGWDLQGFLKKTLKH